MFCRIEILKGETKRVIRTHYRTGASLEDIEEYAERERRLHGGDGFRIRDMHTDQVKEVGPDSPG
jgi:hypothetical protein